MDKPTNTRQQLKSYLTGYLSALLLTLLAFALAWYQPESPLRLMAAVSVLAVLQMLVHLRYFILSSGGREQTAQQQLLIFTLLVIALMVGGTLWIFYSLHSLLS